VHRILNAVKRRPPIKLVTTRELFKTLSYFSTWNNGKNLCSVSVSFALFVSALLSSFIHWFTFAVGYEFSRRNWRLVRHKSPLVSKRPFRFAGGSLLVHRSTHCAANESYFTRMENSSYSFWREKKMKKILARSEPVYQNKQTNQQTSRRRRNISNKINNNPTEMWINYRIIFHRQGHTRQSSIKYRT